MFLLMAASIQPPVGTYPNHSSMEAAVPIYATMGRLPPVLHYLQQYYGYCYAAAHLPALLCMYMHSHHFFNAECNSSTSQISLWHTLLA
jgi:hypothetical protein